MASSPFCKFLQSLQTARPALGSPRQVPTLQALSRLAAAFEPADPEAAGQAPPEASGVSSPTKAAAKSGVSNGAAQNAPAALGKQASQVSSESAPCSACPANVTLARPSAGAQVPCQGCTR